jgi:hypothetical protein
MDKNTFDSFAQKFWVEFQKQQENKADDWLTAREFLEQKNLQIDTSKQGVVIKQMRREMKKNYLMPKRKKIGKKTYTSYPVDWLSKSFGV